MRVNASIDEADVGRVREGQEVVFHVDAFPEREFVGSVEQVRLNPTTTANVVTYNTIVAVDNHDLLLRPGMTATVSVVVRKAENALRLPAAALRFRPEGYQRPGGTTGAAGGSRAAQAQGGGIPGAAIAGEQRDAGSFASGPGRQGARGLGGARPAGAPAASAASGAGGGRGPGRPTTVFVLDERGQPQPVDVRVGISDGQFVEVRDGLDEGVAVVTGTQIAGARGAASGPRPGSSPSSNPFQPQRPQRRQR
jgi:HlyD family secretion protein